MTKPTHNLDISQTLAFACLSPNLVTLDLDALWTLLRRLAAPWGPMVLCFYTAPYCCVLHPYNPKNPYTAP